MTGWAVFCPCCILLCPPPAAAQPSKASKDQGCLLSLGVGRPQPPAGVNEAPPVHWAQWVKMKVGGGASLLASGSPHVPTSPPSGARSIRSPPPRTPRAQASLQWLPGDGAGLPHATQAARLGAQAQDPVSAGSMSDPVGQLQVPGGHQASGRGRRSQAPLQPPAPPPTEVILHLGLPDAQVSRDQGPRPGFSPLPPGLTPGRLTCLHTGYTCVFKF